MKKTFLKLTVVALVIAITTSNCATIISKSSYPVSIDTNPEGAQVSITDKKGKEIFRGKSPAAVRLKSGAGFFSRAEYQVRISSKGYAEKIIPVTFKLNGWYFGNFVFGGLLGLLIIDPASGAMWKIDKNAGDIFENMTQSASADATTPVLKIMDIKNVSEDMKGHLVKMN